MKTRKIQKKSMLARFKGRWLSVTAYGLLLVAAHLLQMSPFGLPELWGARPWLVVPLTVFVAMFEGPLSGGVFGAVAGLLWDMFSQRLLGLTALWLLVAGAVCGLLVQFFLRNNVMTALLLATAVTLGCGLYQWFFDTVILRKTEALFILVRLILPDALYTVCISVILYYILYKIAKSLRQTA